MSTRAVAGIMLVTLGIVGLLAIAHDPSQPQVTPLLTGSVVVMGISILYGVASTSECLSMKRKVLFIILFILCGVAAVALGLAAVGSTLLIPNP